MMKKEIKFECGKCWEPTRDRHVTFKTSDWYSYARVDEYGEVYVDIEAHCPKCKYYSHQRYYLNSLLDMIFELQEEIKNLKQTNGKNRSVV